MSQLFAWGGQSTGVLAPASVLPMNTQDWSLGWTCWIFLQSKGHSRVFSNTTVQKHQFFQCSAFFTVQLSHPYITTGKTIALTRQIFVDKVMSLLFNMLSRLEAFFKIFIINLLSDWYYNVCLFYTLGNRNREVKSYSRSIQDKIRLYILSSFYSKLFTHTL